MTKLYRLKVVELPVTDVQENWQVFGSTAGGNAA